MAVKERIDVLREERVAAGVCLIAGNDRRMAGL